MKRVPSRGIAAALLLLLAAALRAQTAPAARASSQPDEGMPALEAAWGTAFRGNDLEAVLRCYAADAVAWLPDTPEARGEKAIRESYRAFFAANRVQDLKMSDTHYESTGAGRALGWGRFQLTLLPTAGGKAVTLSGRFSEVAEKRGGRWVYLMDHASFEPAPAAPDSHVRH